MNALLFIKCVFLKYRHCVFVIIFFNLIYVFFRDLQGNELTVIYYSDLANLKHLRILWVLLLSIYNMDIQN